MKIALLLKLVALALFIAPTCLGSNNTLSSLGQNRFPVIGVVQSSNGMVLEGASISVKGSNIGVISSSDGSFEINANSQDILIITMVGYRSKEITVGNQTNISIELESENQSLDEVVVIGYDVQRRKDVSGAVSSFNLEKSPIKDIPVTNVFQALSGRIPGLQVGQPTAAGAAPSLQLRGQRSISARNNPLIVLDGVIFQGGINEINNNDIATIDVLEDASSSAIYGSRAANGVIIITTKKGRSENPLIAINVSYGKQNWTRKPEMREGEDFIQWRKDNILIRNPNADVSSIEKILEPKEMKAYNAGHQMDWLDEIRQPAPIVSLQAGVSGAVKNFNYYLSGSTLNQKGVIDFDNYKRNNVMAKFDHKATPWLQYGLNIYYTNEDLSGTPPSLHFATYMTPYSYKFKEGYDNLLERFPTPERGSLNNPYWGRPQLNEPGYYDDNLENRWSVSGIGFISIDMPFVKGLNYRLNFNKRRGVGESGFFHHEMGEVNPDIEDDINNPSKFLNRAYGNRTTATYNQWVIDNLLNYKRSFDKHSIGVLLGYTRDLNRTESIRASGSDFSLAGTTILGFRGLALGDPTKYSIATNYSQYTDVGYIGRFTYNYLSKYYFTFNFRRDGYSAFSEGFKFGNFPGASVAWVLSNEDFFKNSSQLFDYLKLQASYGKNGNQAIDPYLTLANIGTGNTIFGNVTTPYTFPSNLGNKALTWETTTALNLRVDFGLWKSRLSGTIDFYKSNTTDQLLDRALPIMTGYNSVRTNLGEVENKGLNVSLSSINVENSSSFRWETGVVFSLNRNRILRLTGLDANGDGKEDDDRGNSWFIGKSLGALYDYTIDGVLQSADSVWGKSFGFQPGDLIIRDISGPDGTPDGKITADDRSIVGYSVPNFTMNITNTLSYKNLQLYFDINFIAGGGKNNYYLGSNLTGLNPAQLAPEVATWLNLPYWTPARQNDLYPRPNYGNPYGYRFYQSRSFARLQNLSLSYSIPAALSKKWHFQNARVFVSGRNLFTKTKWIGLDPETGGTIGGSNPALRAFTIGFSTSF